VARRLRGIAPDGTKYVVHFDREWREWQVRAYRKNKAGIWKFAEGPTCYCEDREDATQTFYHLVGHGPAGTHVNPIILTLHRGGKKHTRVLGAKKSRSFYIPPAGFKLTGANIHRYIQTIARRLGDGGYQTKTISSALQTETDPDNRALLREYLNLRRSAVQDRRDVIRNEGRENPRRRKIRRRRNPKVIYYIQAQGYGPGPAFGTKGEAIRAVQNFVREDVRACRRKFGAAFVERRRDTWEVRPVRYASAHTPMWSRYSVLSLVSNALG
jgi:hypothetical protein